MRKDSPNEHEPIIIKKYANRRLYNTDSSTYVTLEDLAQMVRSEKDFIVYDARTSEDLTHSVLTQIIVDQESKGQSLLPVPFLRQLIRFYGDSLERLVPSYLEMSLDRLTAEQEKYRKQFSEAFGTSAFELMQEHTRQNMVIFQKTLAMFSPFSMPQDDSQMMPSDGITPQTDSKQAQQDVNAKEIGALKAQLEGIQKKINSLTKEEKT
ncbi:MAG: polyhydroxyalkanoate synthesis repressor PhaR [Pseudomonadota bacterium]